MPEQDPGCNAPTAPGSSAAPGANIRGSASAQKAFAIVCTIIRLLLMNETVHSEKTLHFVAFRDAKNKKAGSR
jgi:hypothetical protein